MRRWLDFLTVNATAWLDDEEWKLVSPWGEHPNRDGIQVVTPKSVAAMVATVNAEAMNPGWAGYPIYMGHPTVKGAVKHGWTSKATLGRVKDIQARDDGLYAKVAWNARGRANKENQDLPYPSVGWFLELPETKERRAPETFDHIGMVENPNIKGVPAWNSASESDDDESDDDENETEPAINNQTENNEDAMKKELLTLLGLPEEADEPTVNAAITAAAEKLGAVVVPVTVNEAITIITGEGGMGYEAEEVRSLRSHLWLEADATVEQVKAAIATRMAELEASRKRLEEQAAAIAALEAKAAAEATVNVDLDAERVTVNAAHDAAVLDLAIMEGRITPAVRSQWQARLTTDRAVTVNELRALKSRLNRSPLSLSREETAQRTMTVNAANEKLTATINAYMEAHSCRFMEAVRAVEADPANAGIIRASRGISE